MTMCLQAMARVNIRAYFLLNASSVTNQFPLEVTGQLGGKRVCDAGRSLMSVARGAVLCGSLSEEGCILNTLAV